MVGGPTWSFVGDAVRVFALLIIGLGAAVAMAGYGRARRGDLHGVEISRRVRERDLDVERRGFHHEVRNALLAIESSAMMLDQDHDVPSEQRLRLASAMHAGIGTLRDLLDVAGPPSAMGYHLGSVVNDRVGLLETRGLIASVRGDLDVTAVGYASWTARALDNLLVNAERHGGAAATGPSVTVELRRRNAVVEVRVMDDGPGVPSPLRQRVFEPGFRAQAHVDGDGLGLHLARELARRQGGDLAYRDRPGGGACFVLSLPVGDAPQQPCVGAQQDRLRDAPAGSRPGPGRHGRDPRDTRAPHPSLVPT
jgi:signal transduction histidine kinase